MQILKKLGLVFLITLFSTNSGMAQESKESAPSTFLFPDWPQPSFDWNLVPVIGLQYSDRSSNAIDGTKTKTTSTTIEGGLGARVMGIPVFGSNPGLSLTPYGGYALGYTAEKVTNPDRTDSGLYHRFWLGLDLPFLYQFSKTTLGVRMAQIRGKLVEDSRMGAFKFDEGILVLPFFATHYTYEYIKLLDTGWSESQPLSSHDNWLSFRLFTSFLNSQLAIGPAWTYNQFDTLKSSSQSWRALAASDLFWKLRARLDARYVASVTNSEPIADTNSVQARLPEQGINETPALSIYPEDSFLMNAFFGIKGLVGGLGFGYRYSLEIFDVSEKNGRKQAKKTQNGIGLFYEAAF